MAKFDLKFNSFRKILQYYNRILYNEEEEEHPHRKERASPLTSKGIFKNSVSVDFFLGNKISFEARLDYKSEEVMMRLVARFVQIA